MNPNLTRIKVKNVSKKFRATFRKRDTALAKILGLAGLGNECKDLEVLKNISFEVRAGDILGIIGRNGSGKSTLLRLIAGVYETTEGEIETHGRIVYLTGLNQGSMPKLTMRENIYLMGSVMGLGQKDIRAKFDEIVDFSGLKEFVDMKVYQFSTGMISRLNFSTIIHCVKHQDPDILLFDEVLSSGGDLSFQEKATQKMEGLIRGGATVLMVSHTEDVLVKNCEKIIWLDNGKIIQTGDPQTVFEKYREAIKK